MLWRRWSARSSKLIELDVVVAQRAGNWRAAGEILVDEGADDVLLETLFLVDDVIRNAEVLSDAARVVDVVQGTATACLWCVGNTLLAGQARLIPELQREADDSVGTGPSPASIAATVEESTPPDMATAMVVVLGIGKQSTPLLFSHHCGCEASGAALI